MTGRFSPKRVAAVCFGAGIFVACAVYIARSFEWGESIALLVRADLAVFFLGGGATVIVYWLIRAFRWRFLLRGMRVEIGFLDLYLYSSVTLSLATVTPFQAGEVLKAELLKRSNKIGRSAGYGSFLIERLADLYVILVVGIVAVIVRFGSVPPVYLVLVVLILTALPIGGYLLLHKLPLRGSFGELLLRMRTGINSLQALLTTLMLTFAGWLAVAAGWQFCLQSLGISVSLTEILGLVSTVTFMVILSLVPGGLGVAEVGTVEFLARLGVSTSGAQAGALILRCYSLLVIGLGIVHLVFWRLRARSLERRTEIPSR